MAEQLRPMTDVAAAGYLTRRDAGESSSGARGEQLPAGVPLFAEHVESGQTSHLPDPRVHRFQRRRGRDCGQLATAAHRAAARAWASTAARISLQRACR